MEKFEIGSFVISKCGHDKDSIYVIIKEETEYVYLVDGVYKQLKNPKKKNKKHIQKINHKNSDLIEKIQSNSLMDEEIKRAIKLYLQITRQIGK